MPACIHGDVCRAWMNERMLVNKHPLSMNCPYGCAYFEELGSGKDYTQQSNQVSTLDEVRLMRQKEIRHIRASIDTWCISSDELEGMVNSEK